MNEKILAETSDYVNLHYPGLSFLMIPMAPRSLTAPIKNNGQNPRQNLSILFNKDAEILKSQALLNKKNHGNMLKLATDLVELFHCQEKMLVSNDKAMNVSRRTMKELNSFSIDVKLIVEVFKANLSLDCKHLFQKMVQKELHDINESLRRLYANFDELKALEIDSFFNVQEFLQNKDHKRLFEGFNYENVYKNCINFFEMNGINLSHAIKEVQQMSRSKNEDVSSLFFEVQKMIIETQKFYSKFEESLFVLVVFVYNQLITVLQKYTEELKSLEQVCLDINQNVLCVIYLSFIKKEITKTSTPFLKDLDHFIKDQAVLPLYENLQGGILAHKLGLAETRLNILKDKKKLIQTVNNHVQKPYFRVFFCQMYTKTCKRLKDLKIKLGKSIFFLRHLDSIKIFEITFTDQVGEIESFIKKMGMLGKNDKRQEGKISLDFSALFNESNEHLTGLNGVFFGLKKYAEFPEIRSLINPLQTRINYYIETLNAINDKLVVFLQKGSEENDQSCLELIAEGERLINDSYYLINSSFNDKIMKTIERSHVENESILMESKKILNLLFELRSSLDDICKEEYICSLILKKKLENKQLTVQSLIINIEGLLLAISNCSYFNISQINSMMQLNLGIVSRDGDKEVKKMEKLKRILGHIKEIGGFLEKNEKKIMEKVNRTIQERMNIEVKFYNFFLFMEEIKEKVLTIHEYFQLNEFSIILFDFSFLEKISDLCLLFRDIDANSQDILAIPHESLSVSEKIKANVVTWKGNIQRLLSFDEKSVLLLKDKLHFIAKLQEEENNILREINGIFALSEKTPRKKKRDVSEKEGYLEKFSYETDQFKELCAEAQMAKDYIFSYRQKGNINQILKLDELKFLISEIIDISRLLSISLKYIKEIAEEENELALMEDFNGVVEDFIEENDVVDENTDENLLRLKFKEFLKEKLQRFQNDTISEKPLLKDLSLKLKKFIQSSVYL